MPAKKAKASSWIRNNSWLRCQHWKGLSRPSEIELITQLAAILVNHNGELSAKALWNYSGLEIDQFYQQLKTEMARSWIVEPEKAYIKEMEAR